MAESVTFEELEKKAQKAESLGELFGYWKEAHKVEPGTDTVSSEGGYEGIDRLKSNFIPDGISSYNGDESSKENKARVLFILKESNTGGNVDAEQRFWFNEALNDDDRRDYANYLKSALERIYPDTAEERLNTVKFGYVNLNKRGGYGKTDEPAFRRYIKKYFTFIRRQIEIINPEKIIFCGCYNLAAREIFENIKNEWKEKPVPVPGSNIILFHINHPSSGIRLLKIANTDDERTRKAIENCNYRLDLLK